MKKVSEVSKLAGISVRTLHYYDEIGLLVPKTMENGYRLYDHECLDTLQQILFFRELGFSLKEIKSILDNPNFDRDDALQKHKHLLELKRNRLDELIYLVDKSLKGERNMSFKEFDMTEIEEYKTKYEKETQERWGHSDAYKQSKKKTAKYKKEDWQRIMTESGKIFGKFAEYKDFDVSDPRVQEQVVNWKQYITKYFYECTDDILLGLSQMYVADERFTKNIDKYGEGVAEFMSNSIKYYCENK